MILCINCLWQYFNTELHYSWFRTIWVFVLVNTLPTYHNNSINLSMCDCIHMGRGLVCVMYVYMCGCMHGILVNCGYQLWILSIIERTRAGIGKNNSVKAWSGHIDVKDDHKEIEKCKEAQIQPKHFHQFLRPSGHFTQEYKWKLSSVLGACW